MEVSLLKIVDRAKRIVKYTKDGEEIVVQLKMEPGCNAGDCVKHFNFYIRQGTHQLALDLLQRKAAVLEST